MKIGLTNIVSCKIGSTQVNRVYIGSTLIWSYSAFDTDAQAFITAASITDTTQQSAINNLVINLKGYGIWTKMKALYPFVGGTAAQHKFNLKNPLDTDAAFRLVFNGGWTHSSTGAKPNGTNAYANSFFNPSLHNIANSSHLSYYSRTLFVDVNVVSEIGCIGTSGSARNAINASYNGTTYCLPNNNNELSVNFASNGVGFYVASRTTATAIMGQRNSTQYTGSATTTRLNQVVGIGANSSIDSGTGWAYYSPRESAFASIGDGLSATEAANYYTAVQTFQTTLNRQVGVPIVADADAQAFLNAAVIEDVTQANAVNTLVTNLKGYGIWTKMKALYPFVGGTASQHKFNLRNPLDTDAAFRLVFNGGWVHSSTGATPNRTNAWADSKLIPNSVLINNNYHLAYYSRTLELGYAASEIGCVNSNAQALGIRMHDSGLNGKFFYSGPYPANTVLINNTDTTGLMIGSRFTIDSAKIYQDGSFLSSNTSLNTGILPIISLGVGAQNYTGFQGEYSGKECALASIGDGLTDTEAANYYTAVQTFQTTLSRNV